MVGGSGEGGKFTLLAHFFYFLQRCYLFLLLRRSDFRDRHETLSSSSETNYYLCLVVLCLTGTQD